VPSPEMPEILDASTPIILLIAQAKCYQV